jgi:outer membrane protein assembly factor BamB
VLADLDGVLLVHYQVPLLAGDDVYQMTKGGTYTPCDAPPAEACTDLYRLNTQVWIENAYRWDDGELVERWSFASDWKPVPGLSFEPMFQPALAGDRIVIPGIGGSVFELDRDTGEVIRRIDPFAGDVDTYVVSAITVGHDGSIYYTTLSLDHEQPLTTDARAGALVVIAPDQTMRRVDITTLIPEAPAGTDLCESQFSARDTPPPFPPPPDENGNPARPPEIPCGVQRPAVNSAPAIGDGGRIFLVSRAHLADRYAYAIALEPDLSLAWATSLRDILDDGCGVTLPINPPGQEIPGACREGSTMGVDPGTNARPAARIDDRASSSPSVLPDGGILVGTASLYNQQRGHLLRFDREGAPVATYPYGWDITPAVIASGQDFEVAMKHNVYGRDMMGANTGPFSMVRLDSSLRLISSVTNTSTDSCLRTPDGNIQCLPNTSPNGFEWCINAPAVDAAGVTYANAEDGFLYAIAADSSIRDRLFLDAALGAAYTPLSIDSQGRVYAMNNGRLFVVGAR